MSTETKEEIKLEEFNDVVDSLQYSGYDPAHTRAECIRRFTLREIVEIVTVYMMVGNNINKMSVKREDEDKARALMIRLQSRGIQGVKPKSLKRHFNIIKNCHELCTVIIYLKSKLCRQTSRS
jgi:hypothetical protein